MARKHIDTDEWFARNIDRAERVLYLGAVDNHFDKDVDENDEPLIGAQISMLFIKGLHILSNGPRADDPIKIIINSCGGDWHHGMAIFDTIKLASQHITVEIRGQASSMASIIAQAADERVIYPNAMMIVHDGEEGFKGQARTYIAQAKYANHCLNKMYEIYASRSPHGKTWWRNRCGIDFILSAKESVKYGLADKIAEEAK